MNLFDHVKLVFLCICIRNRIKAGQSPEGNIQKRKCRKSRNQSVTEATFLDGNQIDYEEGSLK